MKVTIEPYSPEWPILFAERKSHLEQILQGIPIVSIEHIGSTSIPSLHAKPVIDIDIIIKPSSLEAGRQALAAAGDGSVRYNTYLAIDGCESLRNHLDTKRVLLEDEELRKEYSQLKLKLQESTFDGIDHVIQARHTLAVVASDGIELAPALGRDSQDSDEMNVNRPPLHRPTDGRSQQPLLKDERRSRLSQSSIGNGDAEGRPMLHHTRRPTIQSQSSGNDAARATRKKYLIASGFLLLSLASFVVQTETAVYIQHDLHWDKPYAMLYITHGSWILLWPVQLAILRFQKRKLSWEAFWRRHVFLLRTTAQMVETQDVHLSSRSYHRSPVPYMLRTTAFVTSALTIAGGSCDLQLLGLFRLCLFDSLLKDKLRLDKVLAVCVAIIGVLVVAYGDRPDKKVSKGGTTKEDNEASHRLLGNVIIGVGSVLYGLYEVLYKRFACPPEGTSPGRGTIFANTFGSLIGAFTLSVLWIPIPILHILGWEKFSFPTGEAARMLLISICANATFSGSFLVLISLTSPVLSSVAALLTIFLVAIVDWFRTGQPLSFAAILGGILIMMAFFLLSWSTYRELSEERKKHLENDQVESDSDE
ncbi:hypothetical protein N7468_002565 [Penicillium chermesinum]|uniref:EamA domain-containing protein n=1 Tax=Penicillium chermesinum TaxID=63820 RepID=A0A9W9TY34_9EURO|nr:uncharacterized protein N7468_002565 [Penicillium chermesinum]KAJ5247582.1 hypothetical protein N7468_002565 [Penicillium chermesinum]